MSKKRNSIFLTNEKIKNEIGYIEDSNSFNTFEQNTCIINEDYSSKKLSNKN